MVSFSGIKAFPLLGLVFFCPGAWAFSPSNAKVGVVPRVHVPKSLVIPGTRRLDLVQQKFPERDDKLIQRQSTSDATSDDGDKKGFLGKVSLWRNHALLRNQIVSNQLHL